jgi:hypothetical protein
LSDVQEERRDPSTLPEDIFRVLDSETDHEVSEENVEWAGEVFKALLRTRLRKREEKKGEEVLRFSALGKKDRQLWYAANMPEAAEKLPGKQNFKFLYGDVIEVLLLFLAKEAGHEVTDTQMGVECDGVFGSIDAKIGGVVVDVKSASSYSFEKFRTGGFLFDDPFGYVQQLSGYANALGVECQSSGKPRIEHFVKSSHKTLRLPGVTMTFRKENLVIESFLSVAVTVLSKIRVGLTLTVDKGCGNSSTAEDQCG